MAAAASPARPASSASAVAKKPHDEPISARTPDTGRLRLLQRFDRLVLSLQVLAAGDDDTGVGVLRTGGEGSFDGGDGRIEHRGSLLQVLDHPAGEAGGVGQCGPAGPQGLASLLQDCVVGGVSGRLQRQQPGG